MWKYFVFCGNLDFFYEISAENRLFLGDMLRKSRFFYEISAENGGGVVVFGVLWRNKEVVKGYLRLYFVGVNVVGDAKCGYHSQVDCLLIVGYGVEYVFFAA